MTLASDQSNFIDTLEDLWNDPSETVKIADTGDLIESYWSVASVPPFTEGQSFTAGITHSILAPLDIVEGMTAATAALAFEAACQALVLGTIFTPTPPFVLGLPTVPITALPATLSVPLAIEFLNLTSGVTAGEKAKSIGDLIATFLQGWALTMVTLPGAPPVVTPLPPIK